MAKKKNTEQETMKPAEKTNATTVRRGEKVAGGSGGGIFKFNMIFLPQSWT
jgi:hypothetical protein